MLYFRPVQLQPIRSMSAATQVADNTIHPTVIIDGDVRIGSGNLIHPYSVLTGPLEIGDNNIIGPLAVIGSPGQDTRDRYYNSSQSKIVIGSSNIIREHVAVQKPCYRGLTSIGDNTYLMHNAHIPHDAIIADDAVIAPGVVLAGIVTVMKGAHIAIGCSIHQNTVVGPYAIAAMGAAVVKNIRPFSRFIPGQPISVNNYAIAKLELQESFDEIARYVLEGVPPYSPGLGEMIEDYMRRHHSSGRSQY